ncbi:3'-5' exonuclease [Corynebacterium glyciniphilum]|uniref:3'-5' exonuclease n=1 Tax=Corynebacterium glyciniphilum TaxID=1404244 RepID=UPI003DA0A15E
MTTSLRRRLDAALADCVIIDCETTGLDPAGSRIIEIAALHIHDGSPADEFHTLVDPGSPLPDDITSLTGITSQDLDGQPAFIDALDLIASLVEGRTVVGHNVAFDIAFVSAECQRTGAPSPLDYSDVVCTATTARSLIPREQVGRYRLATLADVLDLRHKPSHRAVDDVLATADLLRHLRELSR